MKTFKIGDIIEGEGEVLKITCVGRANYLCEVLETDVRSGWEEVGDEVTRGFFAWVDNRYGLRK